MPEKRLADATSPYLQQHADNPVDWWPWCEEALALARREDRPILLSIGYSACHWCHVMAHESFEDPDTATAMNELYVNIKVDREERPDLDRIYQTAHQLLARRAGGWPLTVFLTPQDLVPFFAGTYFPPQARHGLPAFTDLLRQIAQAYRDQGDEIARQNESLLGALAQLESATDGDTPGDGPLFEAANQLATQFDKTHGGFGGAPKFPHPGTLRFLLRHGARHDDASARHMALHTLEEMANGGINDHLGGGFCRYSVDDSWTIPHFEKMLYDNGQLLAQYAEAWESGERRPLFRHVCERTAEWLMREMQAPAGGYHASIDADSEGVEGKYYVWTPERVEALLSGEEYPVFSRRFGLDRPANFEGQWHLRVTAGTDALAADLGLDARSVRQLLRSAREKLFRAREQRIRPGRDEKILTSWNALTIKGMARAARVFGRSDWLASAQRAADFLLDHHRNGTRLLATSRDGMAELNAYLDDDALLIDALLELLQARWDSRYLQEAGALANHLVDHFSDPEQGGFFFTSDDHETLFHRPKPLSDDAMPAGNAIAIEALGTLSALNGDAALRAAAEQALQAAWPSIREAPYAHVGLLEALQQSLQGSELLIIRGETARAADWQESLSQHYRPDRGIFVIPPDAEGLPDALAAKTAAAGEILAYPCRGQACEPPIRELETLLQQR